MLLAPLLRRTWSRPGHTPVRLQRTRCHQRLSLIGALCVPPTRDRVALYVRLHPNRSITAAEVKGFLRHVHRQLRSPVVLLWDRLRAHRARTVQTFLARTSDLHAVFFPPYAPEWNPIEGLWGYRKGNPLANWTPLDLESLLAGTRHASRVVQHRGDLLRAFLPHSPLFFRLREDIIYAGLNSSAIVSTRPHSQE